MSISKHACQRCVYLQYTFHGGISPSLYTTRILPCNQCTLDLNLTLCTTSRSMNKTLGPRVIFCAVLGDLAVLALGNFGYFYYLPTSPRRGSFPSPSLPSPLLISVTRSRTWLCLSGPRPKPALPPCSSFSIARNGLRTLQWRRWWQNGTRFLDNDTRCLRSQVRHLIRSSSFGFGDYRLS